MLIFIRHIVNFDINPETIFYINNQSCIIKAHIILQYRDCIDKNVAVGIKLNLPLIRLAGNREIIEVTDFEYMYYD
jgi:hypothetical protein